MQIFVSYNRQGEEIARTVVADLEALGHDVWLDQELSGGQSWWDTILETVRNRDLFVFILEPASLGSTACRREYEYATALGKPILPVLVSDGVSTPLLPPALTKIQHIDYRTPDRDAALQLARAIGAAPEAPPLPDPLPEAPEAPLSYLGGLAERVETSATLTYEEQSGLLVDLKRGLRDPETEEDARVLLSRLRGRRDLLAAISFEIDEATRVPQQSTAAEKPDPAASEIITDQGVKQARATPPILPTSRTANSIVARNGGPLPLPRSRLVAMLLQFVAGAGLLYARPELRRKWVYPVGVAAILFTIVLVWLDWDYITLGYDIIEDDTAVSIGNTGLVVYVIGLIDVLFSYVIRRPGTPLGETNR